LLYAVLPHADPIGDLAYDVFGVACVVAMVVGIRRQSGSARLTPWILCAVGLALFVAGDAVWSVYGDILHREAPVASLADALYLPAYVALAVGCLGFARSRGGRDPDALLDATVVALGGGVLVLSLVIMPSAGSLTPVIDRVVVSSYPVMDLAILTVLIRLALVPGRRSPVLWLVLGSFSFMLCGDLVYAVLQQSSSYTAGLLDATWLLAYVGLGAAALHPEMGSLTERSSHREETTLGWGRTAMLGMALLVAPAVLITRGLAERDRGDVLDGVLTAVVSILVLWRIVRATRQRQRVEATLTHTALHDAVTGLPNRRLLLDRLQQAIARLGRGSVGVVVLFLDLDRFKEVNDGLGHATGDLLLAAVGQRLTGAVRPTDTVARLGGDEFVAICEGIDTSEEAGLMAARLMDVLAREFDFPSGEAFVTASLGMALATDPGASAEGLIRDAIAAMYRAKEQGRNRSEFFDDAMRSSTISPLDTVNELHRALARGEFRLHYQPVIDLENGAIVGVEALVRWEHPERGLLAPDQFIPLAESSGLIVPVGWWVMEEALGQAQRWHAGTGPLANVTMNVNVSAIQLREPGFTGRLKEIIREARIDADLVCVELTESTLIDDARSSLETVAGVSAAGVHVALDDFGTGYSSLTYLQRFPVDSLKIDRSFVSGLGTNPGDTIVVEAIIGMARTLGLATVAEGVETREQRDELRALGCTFGQGYLFARPLAPRELEALVDGWDSAGTIGESTCDPPASPPETSSDPGAVPVPPRRAR
jgi:diguanylate cyclase (GGDEF)-like protein